MPQYDNPYYVEPANLSLGLDKALAGVEQGIATRKVTKQTAEDKKAMSDFADNFENMSAVEVGQYVLKNPRVAKFIVGAVETTDKMTKQEKLTDAIEVVKAYMAGDQGGQPQTGQPAMAAAQPLQPPTVQPTIGLDSAPVGPVPTAPVAPVGQAPIGQPEPGQVPSGKDQAVKVLTAHVQENLQRGGNSKEGIELIRDAMTGGDKAYKGAMATIAALDQSAFNSLMKLQGGGEQKSTPATDIDDFVSDAVKVYSAENPNASESDIAKESNRARLQIKRAQKDEAGGVAGARKTAELDVISQMQPGIDRDKAITVYQAGQEEKRNQTAIDNGLIAAESMPNIKRGLSLLKGIETGGFDNAKLAAKRFFGVEGADEGELSNRLAKAVLAQLRNTFGAQFTEGEGQRLIRIEAGFDKSPENNQRLLNQALMMAQGKVDIALKIAEGKGDQAAVDQINSWTGFDLGADSGSPLPAGVTEEDIKTTMQNNNMTREQVLARLAGQ